MPAERLRKRADVDVDLFVETKVLGHAAAVRPVHEAGVRFVEKDARAVPLAHIDDVGKRADIAVHRVNAFKRNQLGDCGVLCREQLLEVRHIVMAEHALLGPRVADSGDHAGVIKLVRKDNAAGQKLGERGERRIVRDVTAGKQQCGFLAVEVRELALKLDVITRVAPDVARAA